MYLLKIRAFLAGGHTILLVVGLALLGAGCGPAPAPAPAPVPETTWATVAGQPITGDDVDKAFRRQGNSAQPLSEEEVLTAKLGLLDDLIVQEIVLAKARALKIEVPESEIDTAYAEAKKNLTDEAFQQELTRRSLTAADLREGLRRERLTQKLLDQEVGSRIAVSEQEVTDFFNANRAQFNLPEAGYHLAQIIVTPVRDAQLANRTGDDATTPQAAAAKVSMLMERLKEGAPFGALAMDFSEDPESAPRGGDLGVVPMSAINQAPPGLRDAVLKTSAGAARVVSQNGAHTIVYVVGQEAAGQRDLSTPEVRDGITQTLRARKEQLLRTAYLTAARTDAEVVNYQARRVVESMGKPAAPAPAPAAAP